MESIDFYTVSLKKVYKEWPQSTRDAIDRDSKIIWCYFLGWVAFLVLALAGAMYLIVSDVVLDSVGNKIQRVGSLMSLFILFGEIAFIYKLNDLTKVKHPAGLMFEIYKARFFKPLTIFTLVVSFILVASGAIMSGYGDCIYEHFTQ